jgi:cyclopropane-fatty-acyl-phospholipid synthase
MSLRASPDLATGSGRATTRRRASPWEAGLVSVVARIEAGRLTLDTTAGDQIQIEGRLPGHRATLILHRPRAARRLLLGGAVGFAEAYLDGDWTSPDVSALIDLAILNETALSAGIAGCAAARLLRRFVQLCRTARRLASRRTTSRHDDLRRDFDAGWRDGGMSYFAALYRDAAPALEEARTTRLDHRAEPPESRGASRAIGARRMSSGATSFPRA